MRVKCYLFVGRWHRVLPKCDIGYLAQTLIPIWFWPSFFAGCGGWKHNLSWASVGGVFNVMTFLKAMSGNFGMVVTTIKGVFFFSSFPFFLFI